MRILWISLTCQINKTSGLTKLIYSLLGFYNNETMYRWMKHHIKARVTQLLLSSFILLKEEVCSCEISLTSQTEIWKIEKWTSMQNEFKGVLKHETRSLLMPCVVYNLYRTVKKKVYWATGRRQYNITKHNKLRHPEFTAWFSKLC